MTFFPAIPTPADLWQAARAWLADVLRRFHGPAGVAAVRALRTLNAIRRRLAALESLVTKLLLVQAAQLSPSSPASGGGRERSEREGESLSQNPAPPRTHHAEDPADPSTWRVRFHPRIPREPTRACAAASPAAVRAAAPVDPHARAQRLARALARRLEALARVIAQPRRAALALLRKLYALGAAAYAAACRLARFTPPRRRRERVAHAHAVIAAIDASSLFHADTS